MCVRLMLFDDERCTPAALERLLEERGLTVTHVQKRADGAGAIRRGEADVVIVAEEAAAEDNDHGEAWSPLDDDRAYERKLPELMDKYEGKYVAMHEGEVVGVGDSVKEAACQGVERLDRPDSLFVVRAGEPLPEAEELRIQAETPRRAAVARDHWPREKERQAYLRMEQQLVRDHQGEFVALHHGEAVGFGETPAEAVKAGCDSLGRRVRLFVHRVGAPVLKTREAPPSFTIDAPRGAVDSE